MGINTLLNNFIDTWNNTTGLLWFINSSWIVGILIVDVDILLIVYWWRHLELYLGPTLLLFQRTFLKDFDVPA